MRVRDIVRASFAAAVRAGAIADYERSGRFDRPERHGSVFRVADRRNAHYASTRGPLYRDVAAWKRAFEFAHAFTAGQAASALVRAPYRLEQCFGSFGRTAPKDAMHCIGAGMEACGLKRLAVDEASCEALFDASDSPRLESLPEPYGKWLMLHEGQMRWDKPVSLRLIVHCRVDQAYSASGSSRDAWPETYLTLALSAPAVSFVEALEMTLRPRLAVAAAARLGPSAATRLLTALPTSHP